MLVDLQSYLNENIGFSLSFQPEPLPVDEYAPLVYVGRWGVYGASLPGRVTFMPGNNGFVTYGAPRPMHV